MAAKWTNIGSIRKNKNGKSFIVFRKGVQILLDGEPVDLGEYNSNAKLFDALESVESLASRGVINEQELAERKERILEKNILRDISVVSEG